MPEPIDERDNEWLAQQVKEANARIKKAKSEQSDRRRGMLQTSAGYVLAQIRDQFEDVTEFDGWAAENINASPVEIADLLRDYKRAVADAERDMWHVPMRDRVQQLWSMAREVFTEYYELNGVWVPLDENGFDEEFDKEENAVWQRWFHDLRHSPAADLPHSEWQAFLTEVPPVFTRCNGQLRELRRRKRREWNAYRASVRMKQRVKDDDAAAFVIDPGKSAEENQRLWADLSGWTVTAKKGFRRDIKVPPGAAAERWRVLISPDKNALGMWKISIYPDSFLERYPSANAAREAASLAFIKKLHANRTARGQNNV